MRYIIATYSNGYCGCDVEEHWAFSDDATDMDISKYLNETVGDYAESYMPCNEEFADGEDEEFYYENCSVDWRDATEEEIEYYGVDKFTPA